MKKFFYLISIAVLALAAVSCQEKEPLPVNITIQLMVMEDNNPLAVEGVTVELKDLAGTVSQEAATNASGAAAFSVLPGFYTASASFKSAENGTMYSYNGANTSVVVDEEGTVTSFPVGLTKAETQQILIKELYIGGCPDNTGTKAYSNDSYVVLYNNSELEADATDIQFSFLAPYNGHGSNKYRVGDALSYENAGWVPAYGAIWWFTSKVTIPAYSELVVAIYSATNHLATYVNSVDLSKPEYYWMSNSDVAQYTNAKYAAADAISKTHYLSCSPFTTGNAWALSNSSPAFFIGRATKEEGLALSQDTANYDHTLGTSAAFNVVKYPASKVVDAVEVWSEANSSKSDVRFPASVNTGHVDFTNQKGYSVYRNVDKEATMAIAENDGKIVTGYADDPSGIDAEASIAKGAKIVYSDTNDSGKDFHQRTLVSLKNSFAN